MRFIDASIHEVLDDTASTTKSTNESINDRSQSTPSPASALRRRQTRVAPFLKMMENEQKSISDAKEVTIDHTESETSPRGLLKVER